MARCKLSKPAFIDSFYCTSWIHLYGDGRLKQFKTTAEIRIPLGTIPSGSTVFMSEEHPGKIDMVYFDHDVILRNHISCKGRGEITTGFYSNDSLRFCFLTEDKVVQGFPCKSSLLRPVYFHANGKIYRFALGRDQNIQGNLYTKNSYLEASPDGKISLVKD